MTNFPHITAATAVALGILQMLLMLYTARGRGRYQTGLGEGQHPALLQRIRMHGNLAENAPLFLILLWLTEASGQWTMLVPYFAIAFVLARLSHALGLSMSSGLTIFRFLGVVVTLLSVLGLAALLAITLSKDPSWIPFIPH